MASINNDKLRRSEFYNGVSTKDRVQDINLNQIKLKKKKFISTIKRFN